MEPGLKDKDRRRFIKTSAGAVGVLSLMPETASAIALKKAMPPVGTTEKDPADWIIQNLKKLENIHHGTPVHQLEHALQTGSLAKQAGESGEMIVASLCHDMAKTFSAFNHEVVAAELLKAYLSESVYNMLKYHGIFQGRFFWMHIGRDHETYLKFKDRPWFDIAMKFTEEFDKPAFKSPNSDLSVARRLEEFVPIIREVVDRRPR